jgi:hypothetical protein
MKRSSTFGILAASLGAVCGLPAWGDNSSHHEPLTCSAIYSELDVNHDGNIARSALQAYPVIAKSFEGDREIQARGYITKAEFERACTNGNQNVEGPGNPH